MDKNHNADAVHPSRTRSVTRTSYANHLSAADLTERTPVGRRTVDVVEVAWGLTSAVGSVIGRRRGCVDSVDSVRVMLLPGIVLPADLAYRGLVSALGGDVETIVKDLEVYRGDAPPPDYSLDTEVAGVLRAADAHGWSRFHLVGYSGGGAAALAVAARAPARLLSMALLEPAWAGGWGWSDAHRRLWVQYDQLEQLPPEQRMPAFMRLQVRPEVQLPAPPPGPPPPWMRQRPAGIRTLVRAFRSYELDREALATFERPVYFALGAMSNPDQFGELAERLGAVFADFILEVFAERHHFDPPHRVEQERLARSLRAMWARAGRPAPAS